MNFLHPRVVNALTAAKLGHCALLYSMILANARLQASGTCGLEQREFAARLRRSIRMIRYQERALIAARFIEVIHHGRSNRRQLRPVPLDALPIVGKKTGNALPHSPATDCRTLGAETVSSSIQRRTLPRSEESDVAPRRGMKASPAKEKSPFPGLMPEQRRTLYNAIGELVEVCRIFRHSWPEVHELVAERLRTDSLARTLDHLKWVANETRGASRETRGGRTLGLLRSTQAKHSERRGARSGRVSG